MNRILATLAFLLAFVSLATAQVSEGLVGINIGGDVTVSAGNSNNQTSTYPSYTTFDRIYDASIGGTVHATWWSTLNPSAGVYNFVADLDPILTSEAAKGKKVEYTFSGVPTYVNGGTQSVVGGTQIGQFTTFLTAMMQHVAANGQCFGAISWWNEFPPGTYWAGTPAQLAALVNASHSIVTTSCPNTIILSPSITAGVESAAPNNTFATLSSYMDSASQCDLTNIHGYPFAPSLATPNSAITLAPELLVNSLVNASSVSNLHGCGNLAYLDEGYACSDPASTTVPANTVAYAQCQAAQLLLAASAGVTTYANSFFGTGCTSPFCGNEFAFGAPLNLTWVGLAKRSIVGWLAGATCSGCITRTAGTNLIAKAPNDASVATGNLAGSGGAGCPSPPAGTGSLPSTWNLAASSSVTGGMSYYVVGDGTSGGAAYIDARVCGTDTNGANVDFIRMDNFTAPSAQGQNVTISACLGVAAGTLTGITEVDLYINEYTSVPAATGQFMSQGAIQPVAVATVPITSQCFQTRYTMQSATAAFAEPYIVVRHQQNVAIDLTLRIGKPAEDVNSTTWSGTITKAGGYSALVAWNPVGGTVTAPVGSTDYRDIFNDVFATSGGATITTSQGPVLIENQLPKFWTFP